MNMEFDFNEAAELLQEKLSTWMDQAILILPNAAIALLVFMVFTVISGMVKSIAESAFKKAGITNKALVNFISALVGMAVIAVGFLVAINILHLDKVVTSLLAGLGIIGFALGFAFQDVAANFVSGVAMVMKEDYPFRVGDFIETNGMQGSVIDIDLRSTTVRTPQGYTVIIPNKAIYENPITNFTKLGKRRVDLPVGVSYADDLEKAEKIAKESIKNLVELAPNEDIGLVYTGFGGSSIDFTIVFWVELKIGNEHLTGKHNAIKAIKKAFEENNITIPFPITTLDFDIKGGTSLKNEIALLAKAN